MIFTRIFRERFGRIFLTLAVMGFLGLGASIPTVAASTDFKSLDLADVVRLAGERNVEAVAANETALQAMERYVQARAALLPQVEGAFSATRQTRNLESVGIRSATTGGAGSTFSPVTDPFTVLDARVSAVQRIFDLGAVRRWELAARERGITDSQVEKTRQDVMALAATLYIDARRTRDALTTAKAILVWSRASEKLVRDRMRIGLATEADLWLARRELAIARAQVRLFRSSVYGKLMELNAVLGWEPRTAWEFRQEALPVSRVFLGTGTVARSGGFAAAGGNAPEADGRGTDLGVALKRSERADALKRAADANFFPQVFLQADYGGNGGDWDDLAETYSYGVAVKAPFFEGGLRQSQAAEAASVAREAHVRLEDAARRDTVKKLDARRRLADARMALMARETGVKYRGVVLQFVRSRRATGQGSELDILEARAGLARAEDERSEARAALDQARVEVAHAEGKMKEWIAEPEESVQ